MTSNERTTIVAAAILIKLKLHPSCAVLIGLFRILHALLEALNLADLHRLAKVWVHRILQLILLRWHCLNLAPCKVGRILLQHDGVGGSLGLHVFHVEHGHVLDHLDLVIQRWLIMRVVLAECGQWRRIKVLRQP